MLERLNRHWQAKWLAGFVLIFMSLSVLGQLDSADLKARSIAAQMDEKVSQISGRLSAEMTAAIENSHRRTEKYEKKLGKLLLSKDSLLKNRLPQDETQNVMAKIRYNDSLLALLGGGPYIKRIDSLKGMLKYLNGDRKKVPCLESIEALKGRLGAAEEYARLLQERQAQWQQLLSFNGLTGKYMPASFKRLQNEVLAYKSLIAKWKETLNDPSKMEAEALKWLNKFPAFQEFMKQNSELARLFGSPGINGASGTLNGLQTAQSMQQLLQQRFGGAQQAQQMLQQQLQTGMGQLTQMQGQLQSRVNSLMQERSYGNTAITPYQQEKADLKAKPLGKRLEFGCNLQAKTQIRGFPSTNDFGLSLGLKVNPKSVMGVGLAYKFGLGTWQKIHWSHEGVAFRSFIDWKIKGNWWVSGGYEMNYWQRIHDITQYKQFAWQKTGVVGVTKKIEVKKKSMKLQLLVDVMKLQTGDVSQSLLFRMGKQF